MRAIFDFFPNLYTYNLYLLIELLVCAITMYFLARVLGQSRLASLFATTCYTFCPYNLWYLELNLGTAHSLFPVTALAFANAAMKRTVGSAVLAGLASCVLIISGHPECAFFGIILSSILMFLMIYSDSSSGLSFFNRTKAAFTQLFGAGATAFFLSAPVLIPFLEYLINAESYKYGSAYSTPVTWNAIFYNLVNPAVGGASPFPGIVASMLLPYGIYTVFSRRRNDSSATSIVWLTIITFVIVAQLGPIQNLFAQPPLTAIITRYALPYLLMLMALVSSKGLESIQDLLNSTGIYRKGSTTTQNVSKLLAAAVEVVCFMIMPTILVFLLAKNAAHNAAFMQLCDFDAMLPKSIFHQSAWKRDLTIACITGGVMLGVIFCKLRNTKMLYTSARLLAHVNLSKAWYAIVPVLLLAMQLVSQGGVARASLPAQKKFYYPDLEITKYISDPLYRTISLREHVFRPSTNIIYDLHFVQMHNPLFPKRFLEYMKAAGASTDTFNQKFTIISSPLLSMASVKYILSIDPISQDGFKLTYTMPNQIKVYENERALPRAYLVETSELGTDAEAALAAISDPNFDPRHKVILEGAKIDTAATSENDSPAVAGTEITSFSDSGSNTVSMKCRASKTSWLVLTDIYYPGWTAYIDEKPVEIARANYAFRAIKIPPGEHVVRFSYEPKSFVLGVSMLVYMVAIGIIFYFNRRKNTHQRAKELTEF